MISGNFRSGILGFRSNRDTLELRNAYKGVSLATVGYVTSIRSAVDIHHEFQCYDYFVYMFNIETVDGSVIQKIGYSNNPPHRANRVNALSIEKVWGVDTEYEARLFEKMLHEQFRHYRASHYSHEYFTLPNVVINGLRECQGICDLARYGQPVESEDVPDDLIQNLLDGLER